MRALMTMDALSMERLPLALRTLFPLFGTLLTLLMAGVLSAHSGAAAAGSLFLPLREVAHPKSVVVGS
jgi:hypothetical protein